MITALCCVICCPLFLIQESEEEKTMEINQERLGEIKAELAECHQIPIEEFSRMIDGVIVRVTGMAEWLKPFVEGLSRLWNSIK